MTSIVRGSVSRALSSWQALVTQTPRLAGIVAAFAAVLTLEGPALADTTSTETPTPRALATHHGDWTGDFKGMLDRRLVRVAVPYGRSLFYHDRGRERGLTAEAVRKFEEHLNKKYKKDLQKRPITVVIIPTTRDELIPALLGGRADIAAGNITITDDRRQAVDFSVPIAKPFSEIVVTGPGGPAIAGLDDLAGKEVFVRPATSYYEA